MIFLSDSLNVGALAVDRGEIRGIAATHASLFAITIE